jgi:ferrous iron transport protein B
MKKIVLVGNPNIGKSALFSRLTGARVNISNYPGTTVEYTRGYMKLGKEKVKILDAPGTYSLEPTSKSERVAKELIEDSDVIINVLDSTNLERNLYLTTELLHVDVPMIVVLNMADEAKRKGIEINYQELENLLNVPVVPTCALTGEGVKTLVDRLKDAKIGKLDFEDEKTHWQKIGQIVSKVQKLSDRHPTFLEKLEILSIKPKTGLPIAALVIYLSFKIIRFIGEGLIVYLFDPLFENIYRPFITRLSYLLGPRTFLHQILIGDLIEGEIDFGQSFGLLTTALYVPIVAVLPYILSFYLALGFLEDLGYLPRLGVLMDNLMHKVGLHGYAIISMILGLGCNVPGALSTRLLESRRERFIASTLMAIAVPCMAQIAVIIGLVGSRGGGSLSIVFATLFAVWVILGLLLNKFLKGSSPEIILEVPPYRPPQIKALFKKLWMRINGFIKKAVPYVLLGVLVVNILYALGIIDFLGKMFSPIITKIWGLPEETIGALLIGFLRKDVAVGMLAPLSLPDKQLIIAAVILAIYFPCVATFMVMLKELGVKDMIKSACIMILVALIVGGVLNFIL